MKIGTLNQEHPDYRREELADHHALYEGGPAFHARLSRFIPQNAQEPSALYQDRKSRAKYENLGGPLVDMIGAWLFSKPPEVSEFADVEWLDNVDGQGRGWADWWRQIFTEDALCSRCGWAWVNLPARPEGVEVASRADEEALGLTRPFLVRIESQSVINWGDDATGRLKWLISRCEESRQDGPFEKQKRVTTWTYIDAVTIQRWEYVHDASTAVVALPPAPGASVVPAPTAVPIGPDRDATDLGAFEHRIGAMPVIRMTLPAGLYAMRKLCDPLVALTMAANDHDWTLHVAAHALMTITTRDGAVQPTLGPGYYLSLARDKDGADAVGFAEPGGASNEARAARIADLRDAVHRVVQQMASSMSSEDASGSKSAASKMADWAGLEVILSAYAAIVRTAMEQTLDLVAHVMSAPDPKVGGLAGWQEDDLAMLVATYNMATPAVKSPTFRRLMAKKLATAFLPDADPAQWKAIDAEIDAADYDEPEVYASGPPGLPPE